MLSEIKKWLPGHPWLEKIQYFDTLDSTNTYAKQLAAEGAAEGTVIIAGQQTFLDELIQIDQIMVACEGGAGLIRGIAVAGGSQGQDLPVLLTGILQKIHKTESFLTHGADTIRTGKRSNVHQNATFAHKLDLLFLISWEKLLIALPIIQDKAYYAFAHLSSKRASTKSFLYFCANFAKKARLF